MTLKDWMEDKPVVVRDGSEMTASEAMSAAANSLYTSGDRALTEGLAAMTRYFFEGPSQEAISLLSFLCTTGAQAGVYAGGRTAPDTNQHGGWTEFKAWSPDESFTISFSLYIELRCMCGDGLVTGGSYAARYMIFSTNEDCMISDGDQWRITAKGRNLVSALLASDKDQTE